MTRLTKKHLLPYLIVLLGVLLLILAFNLIRQKKFIDDNITPIVSALDSVRHNEQLEKELGLTYVQSSKTRDFIIYEYLYPRTYTIDVLSQKITNLLSKSGVEIRKVNVAELNKEITFEVGLENFLVAELIFSPDKTTFAGKICLIIDDFGYNLNSVVKRFLELDIPATFAILPGHAYSKKIANLANEAGLEVMVHMPMESKDFLPGEDRFILSKKMTQKEIRQRMRKALIEISQAKGINNHQGSDATESRKVMRAVAEVLKTEGKYFIDSKTSANSVAFDQMKQANVPVAIRTVFIDYEDNQEIVNQQMKQLALLAREMGRAIGIAHPRSNTLFVFQKEIPRLIEEGFNFVFASEVVE